MRSASSKWLQLKKLHLVNVKQRPQAVLCIGGRRSSESGCLQQQLCRQVQGLGVVSVDRLTSQRYVLSCSPCQSLSAEMRSGRLDFVSAACVLVMSPVGVVQCVPSVVGGTMWCAASGCMVEVCSVIRKVQQVAVVAWFAAVTLTLCSVHHWLVRAVDLRGAALCCQLLK